MEKKSQKRRINKKLNVVEPDPAVNPQIFEASEKPSQEQDLDHLHPEHLKAIELAAANIRIASLLLENAKQRSLVADREHKISQLLIEIEKHKVLEAAEFLANEQKKRNAMLEEFKVTYKLTDGLSYDADTGRIMR